MRKIIVVLIAFCLLLAGCAEKTASKIDYYSTRRNEPLILAAGESYMLLDLMPEAACTIELTAALDELAGDMQLVYVQSDGTEAVIWDSQAPEENAELLEKWQLGTNWLDDVDIMDSTLIFRLTVELQPGESHLEWLAGEEDVSVMPCLLWNIPDGVDIVTMMYI